MLSKPAIPLQYHYKPFSHRSSDRGSKSQEEAAPWAEVAAEVADEMTREESALLGVMHAHQRLSTQNTGHSGNGVEPSPRDPLPLEAPACSKAQVVWCQIVSHLGPT